MERKKGERYGEKFRRRIVKRMNACDNILKLSRRVGVNRKLLYKWRDDLEKLSQTSGKRHPGSQFSRNRTSQGAEQNQTAAGGEDC